jgi:hypothetical protein
VVFKENGFGIETVYLNNAGIAVLNATSLRQGTDSLVAVYIGNTTYSGSTSNTVSQMVTPAAGESH